MSVDYARLNLYLIVIRTEFVSEKVIEVWKTAKPNQIGPNDMNF